MNIIAKLSTIEKEIAEYAEVAGKDIEEVFDEIKQFVIGKKIEMQNTKAASSEDPAKSLPNLSPGPGDATN